MTPRPAASCVALLAVLTAVLAACDSGGTTDTAPNPPNPDPPASVSSISGTVTLPGARTTALPVTRPLRSGEVLRDPQGQPWSVRGASRAAAHSGAVIPGEYLVLTRPGLSTQAMNASLSALEVPSVGTLGLIRAGGASALGLGLYRVNRVLSAAQSDRVQQELATRPGVLSVTPNRRMVPLRTPDDTYYPVQWHYPAMDLPEAWTVTTGTAVTVAVLDTGVAPHPDLIGQLLPGMDFIRDPAASGDGDGRDSDPTDAAGGDYHGTHVTGTVAARTNNGAGVAGVSWGARVVPVRVLGQDGGDLADVLMGALWAAGERVEGVSVNTHPARVINLSLGGEGACSVAEQQVFTRLKARGVVTVVAAGNDDVDASTISPANCADVITVGAVGPDGRRAPYSNHGPRIDVMAPGGNSSLVVTVGTRTYPGGVLSTSFDDVARKADYVFMDGTSMAAPHVAGAVALLLGHEPDLTPAQVLTRLRSTAAPLGSRCDISGGCGAGLVDAGALLRGVASSPPPTPVPPAQPTTPPVVAALYLKPDNTPDYALSRSTELPTDSLTPPYTLGDLVAGSYVVAAWQDLDADDQIDDGEPFGMYPDTVTLTSTGGDLTGIDVTLEAFSVQGASVSGQPARREVVKRALETLKTPH